MSKIYAIADLHFSGKQDKPMGVFGAHWENHQEKIIENWKEVVKSSDIVLIPGDISWAMYLKEAMSDLEIIHKLPGKKILLRGNHDYWWEKIKHLNSLYENMMFLQNNSFCLDSHCIAGTRGWICPGSKNFTDNDFKIYQREIIRLELSLKSIKELKDVIVMMHYPPFNEKNEDSGFIEVLQKYNVKKVVYGHLHDTYSFNNTIIGEKWGIDFQLVSADYLEFSPVEVRV
jgi:hypothetical protein